MDMQGLEDLQYPAADRLGCVGKGLVEKHRAIHWPILPLWCQHVGQARGNNGPGEGFLFAAGFAAGGIQHIACFTILEAEFLGIERELVARIEQAQAFKRGSGTHGAGLEIPLQIVATDFWERRQVVFSGGELAPAIAASIAIPGYFTPVSYRGQVLVDGGLVNPVPYDLLLDDCDTTIAVDVIGEREPQSEDIKPSYFETTFNAFQILQATVNREKLLRQPPQIYIKPDIKNIRVLEFYKFEEIFRQARSAKTKLVWQLRNPFL